MIKLKLELELHNKEMIIKELDHILHLIIQNFPSGNGWFIEGEDETEPKYPDDFLSEQEEELPIIKY